MKSDKKPVLPKFILLSVPFLLLPVLSALFRNLGTIPFASRFAGVSLSGGEALKTVYHIFSILAFLCCLRISSALKKLVPDDRRRAVRVAYIAACLIYNVILVPIFLYCI